VATVGLIAEEKWKGLSKKGNNLGFLPKVFPLLAMVKISGFKRIKMNTIA
jgi:hypothetical protein